MAARKGKRSAAKARATPSRSAKARTKKPRASKRAAAPSSAPPVQVARIAKGKKPLYFSDPAIDKLLWMTLTIMEELSVTRDRLDAGTGYGGSRGSGPVPMPADARPSWHRWQ